MPIKEIIQGGINVEGKIYYHYSNGIGILTDGGIVFVENGKYEIIDA